MADPELALDSRWESAWRAEGPWAWGRTKLHRNAFQARTGTPDLLDGDEREAGERWERWLRVPVARKLKADPSGEYVGTAMEWRYDAPGLKSPVGRQGGPW